ncbi:hypothetical protein CDAR_525761 [Caerostris darwini]|uniref:Uncharacterized protein n=1 Tax=Caerostris darwini TaxID=1538125 RepID=A0AAV4RRA6_9ARAC|nr:hypothetical protein CDAR_525761 [Caerostris darwini]
MYTPIMVVGKFVVSFPIAVVPPTILGNGYFKEMDPRVDVLLILVIQTAIGNEHLKKSHLVGNNGNEYTKRDIWEFGIFVANCCSTGNNWG